MGRLKMNGTGILYQEVRYVMSIFGQLVCRILYTFSVPLLALYYVTPVLYCLESSKT